MATGDDREEMARVLASGMDPDYVRQLDDWGIVSYRLHDAAGDGNVAVWEIRGVSPSDTFEAMREKILSNKQEAINYLQDLFQALR